MTQTSRRTFLRGAATAAGAAALASRASAVSAAVTPRTRLAQFGYGDVQLLDGPMLEQFRTNHAFFLALDDDRLLQPFRQKAGLPAPGEPMGGWYSWSKDFDPPRNLTGYVPGHAFGQWVSALSRAYAATGDKPTQAKVHRLVRGYAETISPNFWLDYPLPCYTSDKTACGLIDAHTLAGDADALPTLRRATATVMPFLPPRALTRPEMAERPHPNIAWTWDEPYTLPENFFLAWKRSGDPRYRILAERFLADRDYFDPLADGDNVLPGLHAYSHVNALSSAMQAWLVMGSEKHLRAARNGFRFVRETQSYATGGWGPNETFRKPGSGDMGASLTDTHASFETPCGSYAHFKITRYLLRATGDSRYGDSMEQVLYNTVLGALPILPDGHSFYYSDYNNHGSKFRHPDKWPCCSGTLPQVTADYGISSYFHDHAGIYVNLFVPSRVTWRNGAAHFGLEQRTQYPYLPATSLRIYADRPQTLALHVRVPAWAGAGTRISVNGKAALDAPQPGRFATLHREWKDGDRVEVEFAMPTRLEAIDPQHPDTVALMAGPLSLFAVDSNRAAFTRGQLLAAQPNGSREWIVRDGGAPVVFRDFPSIQTQNYRLYHTVTA